MSLFVVAFVVSLLADAMAANPVMHHRSATSLTSSFRRWIHPCSGRHQVSRDAAPPISSTTQPEVTTDTDIRRTFRSLATSAKRLKKRVRHLKTLYVGFIHFSFHPQRRSGWSGLRVMSEIIALYLICKLFRRAASYLYNKTHRRESGISCMYACV